MIPPSAHGASPAELHAATAYGEVWDAEHLASGLTALDDPRLWRAAAQAITRRPDGPDAPGPLLDALAARDEGGLRVVQWRVRAALRASDGARAAQALDELRVVAERCALEGGDCRQRAYEVRDVAGRLAALGETTPRTWQEALTAAAWRCHLAGAPHAGTSTAEVDGGPEGWRFGAWDRETPAVRCLSLVEATVPLPAEALHLTLVVEGEG